MRQSKWKGLLDDIRGLWVPERRRHLPPPSSGTLQATALRAYLDEKASAWPFTDAAIAISPAAGGVYLLYAAGRLIYIGAALAGAGIREELESHRQGAYGSRTQGATAFVYELSSEPLALQRYYIEAYRQRYGGRLPAGNQEP